MIPMAFGAGGNRILRLDTGHQDAGEPLNASITTGELAPAGASADCTFERLYLTLTHTAACELLVTPILDGVALPETHSIELQPEMERRSRVFDLPLSRVLEVGGVEAYRYALRGTWIAFRLETVGGIGEGDLIFDSLDVRFTVETPSKERAG